MVFFIKEHHLSFFKHQKNLFITFDKCSIYPSPLVKNISQYDAFLSLSMESQYLLLNKTKTGSSLWPNGLAQLYPHNIALSIHLSLSLSHLKSCLSSLHVFFSVEHVQTTERSVLESTSVSLPESGGCFGGSGCSLSGGTWQCLRMPICLGTVGGLYRAELIHCILLMSADVKAP